MATLIKKINYSNSVKELRYKLMIIYQRQRHYRKMWLEMDIKKGLIKKILEDKLNGK